MIVLIIFGFVVLLAGLAFLIAYVVEVEYRRVAAQKSGY